MKATKDDLIVVGISRGHNSSVCLLKNNEVIFHIESERLSNIKYDMLPFQAISLIKEYVDHVDIVAIAGMGKMTMLEPDYEQSLDPYSSHVVGLGRSFQEHGFTIYDFSSQHHLMHATAAFYNSGFDNALCIVKDGYGSDWPIQNKNFIEGSYGREGGAGSVFKLSYPDIVETIYKEIMVPFNLNNKIVYIDDSVRLVNSYSEGILFEATCEYFGMNTLDAGKIMGMSAYGQPDKNIPDIYKNGEINRNIFSFEKKSLKNKIIKFDIDDDFQSRANFSYAVQKAAQKNVAQYIVKMLNKTKAKNLCLSGGFFLNCVSNYNLLNYLPDDTNLYIEPISSDAGTSIGAAKFAHYIHTQSKEKKKQNSIYLGPKKNYCNFDFSPYDYEITNAEKVAEIISKRNIVAIFQGGSESGPRALGNRSILYDPRDPDGKDHVNKVKGREWYRPFAGSVLKECASLWFDMNGLDESKFMMFAINVKEDKKDLIPAITHIDGTCRVQTVTRKDNENFYNLIEEFYKITGVPILFNTSFNLAGDCIVETLQDAINTLFRSKIDYLYLPENNIIIKNSRSKVE